MQLVPDRKLVILFQDKSRFRISVSGYADFAQTKIPTNIVKVILQTRTPGIPGELGWVAVDGTEEQPNPLPLRPSPPDPEHTGFWTWSAVMSVPSPRGTKPFRLVVMESERFGLGQSEAEQRARIVYIDTLEI